MRRMNSPEEVPYVFHITKEMLPYFQPEEEYEFNWYDNEYQRAFVNTLEEAWRTHRPVLITMYDDDSGYTTLQQIGQDYSFFNDGYALFIELGGTASYTYDFYLKEGEIDGVTYKYVFLSKETEEYLTTDYTRTVLGQSLQGSGAITVYKHDLTIRLSDNSSFFVNVYSANPLNIDSLQDLTTVVKPTSGSVLIAFGTSSNLIMSYSGTAWSFHLQSGAPVSFASIADGNVQSIGY